MSQLHNSDFRCISRLEKKTTPFLILISPDNGRFVFAIFSISSSFQLQFARCVSFVPSLAISVQPMDIYTQD